MQDLILNCKTIGEQAGAMIQAADGKFYGVTLGNGGVSTKGITNGTIWTIDAGLPAPPPTVVNFAPLSGEVGKKILLQGNHFVGTTAVAFNGVSATFQLLSANYIRATVPTGATTGPITVTNTGGTVTSMKSFTVQ